MGFELWAKPYGIKLRCYWEYLGEHILEQLVNLGIFWEIDENPMGTGGNTLRTREKNKKIILPPTSLKEKKKLDCSRVHAEPSHWLHDISVSKTVPHHFSNGLTPLVKNWDIYSFP
jgi:hypothetical protein